MVCTTHLPGSPRLSCPPCGWRAPTPQADTPPTSPPASTCNINIVNSTPAPRRHVRPATRPVPAQAPGPVVRQCSAGQGPGGRAAAHRLAKSPAYEAHHHCHRHHHLCRCTHREPGVRDDGHESCETGVDAPRPHDVYIQIAAGRHGCERARRGRETSFDVPRPHDVYIQAAARWRGCGRSGGDLAEGRVEPVSPAVKLQQAERRCASTTDICG